MAVFAVPIVVWVGIYLFTDDMKIIRSYGIPLAFLVTGAYLVGADYMGKRSLGFLREGLVDSKGISAEREVAEFLNSLPPTYFVIHGLRTRKGDVDHVLVCPKGIFAIETKSYTGSVNVGNGEITKNGRPFEKDPIVQARAGAWEVQEKASKPGKPFNVDPVIIFPSAARVRIQEKVRGVRVVSIRYFPKLIERLPVRLSNIDAVLIYRRLMKKENRRKLA